METTQLAKIALSAVNSASIPGTEAANVAQAQQWLYQIANGDLDVIPADNGLHIADGEEAA